MIYHSLGTVYAEQSISITKVKCPVMQLIPFLQKKEEVSPSGTIRQGDTSYLCMSQENGCEI